MSQTESDPTGPGPGRAVDALNRALRDASTRHARVDGCSNARRWARPEPLRRARSSVPVRHPHPSHRDSINEWGVFASTTEALTVTILTELVCGARKHPEVPSSVSLIFDGVYAAERDHWRFTSKHWLPSTTRFWIPDGFFGGAGDALDLTAVGKSVAAGEHLFVNTYLIGSRPSPPPGARGMRATRPSSQRTSPSTACSGKRWRGQARPTTSDSRSSNLIASVRSRPPPKAPASASASKGRPRVASTTSRGRLWPRGSRSARTNHDRQNATPPRPRGGRGALSPEASTDRPG